MAPGGGRCVSSASERHFPPQPSGNAKHLPYSIVRDPAAPPIRPERHVLSSIATVRRKITVAMAKTLSRCPCCQSPKTGNLFYSRLWRSSVSHRGGSAATGYFSSI